MDERWIDMTVIGSDYAEERELFSGRYRRRQLSKDVFDARGFAKREYDVGEWEYMYVPTIENGGIKL